MIKNTAGILVPTVLVAVAAWLLYPNSAESPPTPVKHEAGAGFTNSEQESKVQSHASWPGSPFGNGPSMSPSPQHVLPDHVLQRKQKMVAMGYGSPPEYYEMDLRTLQTLAKDGDGDAMLQLAEQYYEEASRLRSDAAFPKDADPRLLAKQYLADAVNAGFSRAATILSKRHSEENNIVDAYAWRLVSEKIGDGNNPMWGKDTNQFAAMSEEQKQLSNTRSMQAMEAFEVARRRSLQQYKR